MGLCNDKSGYYTAPPDITISQIHACWMFHGAKPRGWIDLRFQLPLSEVWQWRLFRFRGQDAPVEYWDEIRDSMLRDGWWESDPLLLILGADGCITMEGNHRLQIAREIGITTIPARIADFYRKVCGSYPPGIQPSTMAFASQYRPEVLECDYNEFRRAIDSMSASAPDWDSLVDSVVEWCRNGKGLDPRRKSRNMAMIRGSKSLEKRERAKLREMYLEWVREQVESMMLVGVTWPLPLTWPNVTKDQLQMHSGYMSEEAKSEYRAAKMMLGKRNDSKRVSEKSDRAVDEIMRLLSGR